MEILKDNPKQGSWEVWYHVETNHIYTGSYNPPEDQGYVAIPNPVFTAKFKITDIYPTASSIGLWLRECDCPLFSALKGEYGEYSCVGRPAKEIIHRVLNGKFKIAGNEQGWFEGVFTMAKKGSTYTIDVYDGTI